jgi:hypothetical protein
MGRGYRFRGPGRAGPLLAAGELQKPVLVHSELIGSWSTLAYPIRLPFDGIFASFLFWVP